MVFIDDGSDDAALADQRTAAGGERQEVERLLDVRRKAHEVAVVDADEFCRRRERSLHVAAVMHLDERVHAKAPGQVEISFQLFWRQDTRDEQVGIGPEHAGSVILVFVDVEILA